MNSQAQLLTELKRYGIVTSSSVLSAFKKAKLILPDQDNASIAVAHDYINQHIKPEYQPLFLFEQYIQGGEDIAEVFKKDIDSIHETLKHIRDTLAFIDNVNSVCEKADGRIERVLIDSKSEQYSQKELKQDQRAARERQISDYVIPDIKELLSTSNITIDDTKHWQSEFAYFGKRHDQTKDFFGYMECIPLQVRQRAHGIFKLVMYYYDLSYDLEWVMRTLGEAPPYLHTLITNKPYRRVCVYCDEEYEPSRTDAKNCGKPKCQKAYKTHHKRIQRKRGIYS